MRFQCLTLWPWTCLSVALGSGITFTKFNLRQLIRAWIIAFFDAGTHQAVTLIFDLLTLKVRGTSSVTWSKSIRNLNEIEQSPAELLMILRIFAHVMSRRDLWPLDLELLPHFGFYVFKLCTQFERNRIIQLSYRRFSAFTRAILGGGSKLTELYQGCVDPTYTKLGQDKGRSSQHCTLASEFRYLAAFSNAGGSKLSDLLYEPNFALLTHLPVKIREGVGEIPIPNVKALPTTETPK